MKLESYFALSEDFTDFTDLEMFLQGPGVTPAHTDTDQTVPTTGAMVEAGNCDNQPQTLFDQDHDQFRNTITSALATPQQFGCNQVVPVYPDPSSYTTTFTTTTINSQLGAQNLTYINKTEKLLTVPDGLVVPQQPELTTLAENAASGQHTLQSPKRKVKPGQAESPKSARMSSTTRATKPAASQRKRKKANDREKHRIVILKEALDVLKNSIPAAREKPKLTKLQILLHAQDYIKSLKLQLAETAFVASRHDAKDEVMTGTTFIDQDSLFYCNYEEQLQEYDTAGDMWQGLS